MWDEFVIGGYVQETSKKNVLKAISDQDMLQEVCNFLIVDYFYDFHKTLTCDRLLNDQLSNQIHKNNNITLKYYFYEKLTNSLFFSPLIF